MSYQPTFRYWTIRYTFSDGSVERIGAYADKGLADLNASLNEALNAVVEPVYY